MPAMTLPAEVRLILLTAGGAGQDEPLRGLLAEPLDWARVTRLASQQGATLVLWQRLHGLAPDRVPGEARETLRRLTMVTEFRQAHLEQLLHQAVRTLTDAGIRVLLLKGAALAVSAYGAFHERPMGDIDLMVDPDRAAEAQALLLSTGWRSQLGSAMDAFYLGHQHLPPLADASGTGLGVEVHLDLLSEDHPFRVPPASLWAEATPIEVGGSTAYVLGPAHALLHLCIHFLWSHMGQVGAWRTFRDIHVLTGSEFDWRGFCTLAHQARAATCCYWTLQLARNLTAAPVPAEALQSLAAPQSEWLRRAVERHLTAGLLPAGPSCPSVRLSKLMWEAAVRPRSSGHGDRRPWRRSEELGGGFRAARAPAGLEKLRTHLREIAGWRRYLGAMLLSSAPR